MDLEKYDLSEIRQRQYPEPNLNPLMTALFLLIALLAYAFLGWILYSHPEWIKPLPIVGNPLGSIENNLGRTAAGILTMMIIALAFALGGVVLTAVGNILIHPIGIIAYVAVGWFVYTRPPEKIKFCGAIATIENTVVRTIASILGLLLLGVVLAYFSPVLTVVGKVLLSPITVPFSL